MLRRVLAQLLLAALPLLPAGAARAVPFDAARLATIPMLDVIRLATAGDQVLWLVDAAHKREALAQLDTLPASVRTLVWLAVIEGKLVEPSAGEPPAIVFAGQFKARMAQAMEEAGLAGKAALFRGATAATPEPALDDPRNDRPMPRLVPLGAAFGDKGAFDRDMLAFIAAHPDAARWCDERRATLTDEERLLALTSGLVHSDGFGTAAGMTDWPAPFRTIALADMYAGEVDNGGVHQYFLNSSGNIAPEAVEAMAALGLPKQAAVIRRGMGFFPLPYPSDKAERFRSFDHDGTTDWDDRLNALTDDADDGTLNPAMIAYAKREATLPR